MLAGVPPILATVRPVRKSSLTSFGKFSKSLRDEAKKKSRRWSGDFLFISVLIYDVNRQPTAFPLPPLSSPARAAHRPPNSLQSYVSSAVSTFSPHCLPRH